MKKIILIPAIAGLLFTASANANLLSQSTFDNNTNNVASDAWTGLAPGFDPPYNNTDFFRFDGDRISTDQWIGPNNYRNKHKCKCRTSYHNGFRQRIFWWK